MKEKIVLVLVWSVALAVGFLCWVDLFFINTPDKTTRGGWLGVGIVLAALTFEKTLKALKALKKSLEDDSPEKPLEK